MSKSSKRRLAQAAIKNAADNPSAESCTPAQLTQAAGTASALTTHEPASPSSALLVPSVLSGLSASGSDVIPSLNLALSTIKLPSDPISRSAPLVPCSKSEISNFKSPSDSVSAPPLSPSPSPPPAAPASPRGKTLQEILAEPPSEFFKNHLEPHCPPETGSRTTTYEPIISDPNDPAGPIDSQFDDYQAKLKPVFAKLSPDDPNIERIMHNYIITMQVATVERLIHDLPGMSEAAQVETNNQIVRMLFIIERTNSRRSRELRDKEAAARRIIREQQRKERQAQKEQEAIARTQRNQQRTKDREEQRRQREQAKADRAEQNHQLAVRKLELKERNLNLRAQEKQLKEQQKHNKSAKSKKSLTAPRPLGPPNTWTCG